MTWASLKPKLNFYPTLRFFDCYHQIVGKAENQCKRERYPMFFIWASWTLAYFPLLGNCSGLFNVLVGCIKLFSKKGQKNPQLKNQSRLFKDLNGRGFSWLLVVDWILRPKGFLLFFFPKHFRFRVSFKPKCRSLSILWKICLNYLNMAFFSALRANVVMTKIMKIIEFLKPM